MQEEHIHILSYVEKHCTEEGFYHCNQLITLFKQAPSPSVNMMLTQNEYLWRHYQNRQSQINGATMGYAALQHYGILMTSKPPTKEVYYPKFENQSQEYWLFIVFSSLFKLYGVGNCSHRSSFSAIYLRKILPKEINVVCENFPEKDHFIVIIGNKENGFFIYDPLPNPTLLFNMEYYKKEILPLYLDVNKIYKKYKLILEKEYISNIEKDVFQYSYYAATQLREFNFVGKIDEFIALNLLQISPILKSFNTLGIQDKASQISLMREAILKIDQINNNYLTNTNSLRFQTSDSESKTSILRYLSHIDLINLSRANKAQNKAVNEYLGTYKFR